MPARTEPAWPASGVGFTTIRTSSPASAASIGAGAGPVTTSTGSRPAARTPSTAWRTIGCPPTGSSSLACPIRRARPAASTSAAIRADPQRRTPRGASRGARGRSVGSTGGLLHGRGGRLHRALGEHAQQVALVLHRSLQVGLHVHALGRLLGRRLDGRGVGPLAGDRGLDALGAHRLGAGAGDAPPGLAPPAARPP